MDKTQKTIQTFTLCAEAFQSRFMDLSLYHTSFDKLIARLQDHAGILDVGCGPGNCTKYLIDANESFSITGIDLSESMIDLAKSNVPKAAFVLADIRSFAYQQNHYDAIVAAFCLPFLYDDEASTLIGAFSQGLKPGGILYLSTMKGEGHRWETTSFSGPNEIFFNYYTPEFLKAQFQIHGLDILEEIHQDYLMPASQPLVDMIYLVQKRPMQTKPPNA